MRAHGVDAFYDSVELRKDCCAIRKSSRCPARWPAKARGSPACAASNRSRGADLPVEEFDAAHGLRKFNPLADWSNDDVWDYIRANDVPYNALHDRGYPSIGCAPCTRAVEPGEDMRAGRWWWEAPEHKECGLHPRSVAIPVVAADANAAVTR